MKKILVIGIIFLFIGVSVSSAISVDCNEIIVNNQGEDCKECQEVSRSDLIRLERLLDRVEVYSKLLLVLSKYNSELKEMSEELSNQLSNINKLYDEFNTDVLHQDMHPICIILVPLYVTIFFMWAFAGELFLNAYFNDNLLLAIIFLAIVELIGIILDSITEMIREYECEIPF